LKRIGLVLALLTAAFAQPYTAYFTNSPGLPTNYIQLDSKNFKGLNTTNNVDCTPYAYDPFFMMNCDKGEF
jgi:hypothetical protein